MKRVTHLTYLAALAIVILVGGLGTGWAAEFDEPIFVVQESKNGRASWMPQNYVIDAAGDLDGGLRITLANPSNRAHIFVVYDLLEMVPAVEGKAMVESDPATYTLKPIRVTVPPSGTKQIQVATQMLKKQVGQRFKYFCPKHSPGTLNRAIWVVGKKS